MVSVVMGSAHTIFWHVVVDNEVMRRKRVSQGYELLAIGCNSVASLLV